MRNKEVIQILRALQRLDSYKNAAGQEVPYHFSGDAAFAIGKNIRKATVVEADIEAARVKLVKALLKPDEKGFDANDPRAVTLTDELISLFDQESDFVPHKFKLTSLKLDINPLPPTALAVLIPLIQDEDTLPTPMPAAGGV